MESSCCLLREYVSENEDSIDGRHSDKQPIYTSLILSIPGPFTVGQSLAKPDKIEFLNEPKPANRTSKTQTWCQHPAHHTTCV